MLKCFKVRPKQIWDSEKKNRRLYQIKDVEQAYAPYNSSIGDRSDRDDSLLKNKESLAEDNARE